MSLVAIGRATLSGEADERDASTPAEPTGEGVTGERMAPTPGDPPPAMPPPASTPAADPSVTPSKPDAGPRARRREAVSLDEATTAAERALPSLRACTDAPRRLTVDLDIARGRGAVTALNLRTPAPGDPAYPWHACVLRALERVRYPASDAAGHARIRLTLR